MIRSSANGQQTRHVLVVALRVVARRPGLASEALRTLLAVRSDRGSRRRYLQWRTLTAYGDLDHTITSAEMVDFLKWRRRLRLSQR